MTRFTQEMIDAAFASASPSIRFYIEEGRLADAVGKIIKKNSFPSSLAVPLAELGHGALLGLIPPAVFSKELAVVGAPSAAIGAITSSFYEEVVKKAAETKIPEPFDESTLPPLEETPPEPQPSPTTHDGIEQHMLPEGHHHDASPASMPKPATTMPVMKVPVPAPRPTPQPPARPIPAPAPRPAPMQEPIRPRTMASDVEALGGGKNVPKPTPRPQPAPMPKPVMPQAPVQAPSADAVHADLKKYGVDPYREPVE